MCFVFNFLRPRAGVFFVLYDKNHRKSSNMCFFQFFAPGQETFADAGDEDGGGPFGTIWEHVVSIILDQF